MHTFTLVTDKIDKQVSYWQLGQSQEHEVDIPPLGPKNESSHRDSEIWSRKTISNNANKCREKNFGSTPIFRAERFSIAVRGRGNCGWTPLHDPTKLLLTQSGSSQLSVIQSRNCKPYFAWAGRASDVARTLRIWASQTLKDGNPQRENTVKIETDRSLHPP